MVHLALACSCLSPMLNLVCYVWLYYNWSFVFNCTVLSCVAACYVIVADCQLRNKRIVIIIIIIVIIIIITEPANDSQKALCSAACLCFTSNTLMLRLTEL